MPRRRGVWGKKGPKAGSTRQEKAAPRPRPRPAASEHDQLDYSAYYDKCYSTAKGKEETAGVQESARGQFDDLVLLEDVSNEGIVEVSQASDRRRGSPSLSVAVSSRLCRYTSARVGAACSRFFFKKVWVCSEQTQSFQALCSRSRCRREDPDMFEKVDAGPRWDGLVFSRAKLPGP